MLGRDGIAADHKGIARLDQRSGVGEAGGKGEYETGEEDSHFGKCCRTLPPCILECSHRPSMTNS